MLRATLVWVVSALISAFGVLPSAQAASQKLDLKSLIRDVSTGSIQIKEDLGVLSPYFKGFRPLNLYEESGVFLAVGLNQESELILFAWNLSDRRLDLDALTERWADDLLSKVKTEEELPKWKELRRLVRGAVLNPNDDVAAIQAIAFIDTLAVIGEAGPESEIPGTPVAFRFLKAKALPNFAL
jgi:hypothetical protein